MASSIVVVGSYVQDLTFALPEFPQPGQTLIGSFKTGPGGKGSNQAVAAARTGVTVSFIGATGIDAFAQVALEFHKTESIDSHLVRKPGHATGTAGILVNDHGENEIVVALGANNQLACENIQEELLSGAKMVVTQLESNLEATAHVLKCARIRGITTLLNPAPMRDDFPMELLEHVDILVPNETEFAHLVRARFPTEHASFTEKELPKLTSADLHALCRDFKVPTFIITLGSKGSFCSTEDAYFTTAPLTDIEVVDTTGAGDAFVGGFASGMVQFGGNLEKAVLYATVVAGLSVTKFGTAPAMPQKKEIQAEIEKQGLAF